MNRDHARLYGLTLDELRYTLRGRPQRSPRRRFPWRDIPRAEREGSQAVWGVSDETSSAGGLG